MEIILNESSGNDIQGCRLDSFGSGGGLYENSKKHSGSIKDEEFLD
jgi:hypothetical protein